MRQASRRLLPPRLAEQFVDAGRVEVIEEEWEVDEVRGADPSIERRRRPLEFVEIRAAAGAGMHGGESPRGLGPTVFCRDQVRQRDLIAAALLKRRRVKRFGFGSDTGVVKISRDGRAETARAAPSR
jgi:hypothetical protein